MKCVVPIDRNFGPLGFGQFLDSIIESMPPAASNMAVPLDIVEQGDRLILKAQVPGIAPEDIDVQLENNILTIKGEVKSESTDETSKVYRRELSYGAFTRSVRLPEGLDLEQIEASFANGIATIVIPKVPEVKPQAKKITFNTN